ncbi:MAG: DUF4838 domain-containing protein [Lentisphaeria bacterium]|nr:DUF4838 domain-containing protein [Lentisphaeria bacterium]
MKKHLFLSGLVLMSGLWLAVQAAEPEIEVAQLRDVYYAEPSAAPAAKELANYLSLIFGGKFAVSKAKTAEKPGFYIGRALAPKEIKSEHREQIFRQIDPDGKIFLWGAESNKKIPGDHRAVEDFLERECSVRWLWPGPSGEVVPQLKSLKLKPGFHTDKPAFAIRVLKYGIEPTWGRRMKLGQSVDYITGHSFNKLVPPAKYFAEHPEYYALVSARNWIGSADKPKVAARCPLQICTSNPEVRKIVAQALASKNTEAMQSIMANDGYGFCECELCKKLDREPWTDIYTYPNLSDRMWDFARDVAVQAKKLNPKTQILFGAYAFYDKPPVKLDGMPDNISILKCIFGSQVKDWAAVEDEFAKFSKLGKLWIYEYWGSYTQSMPWNVIRSVDKMCKLLKKYHGIGMRTENSSAFASSGLVNYVGAKLLWNPDADVNALVDDYCEKGFGAAAPEMKAYYSLVEKYTEEIYRRGRGGYTGLFTMIPKVFDREFFRQADDLFRKASKKPISAQERARIQYVRYGLEYARMYTEWTGSLAQVNTVGGSLPLVYPADKEPEVMNDAVMSAAFARADKACLRRHFMQKTGGIRKDFSLDYNDRLDLTLVHMPYHFMVQHLVQSVRKGFANYFINNAFELRNPRGFPYPVYGWRIEGGTPELNLKDCHDDVHDVAAMYHAKQGIALQLTLKPGETARLSNAVKVVVPPGTPMAVSGWFKGGVPELEVVWNIDGKTRTEKVPAAAHGLKELSGWQETAFAPFKVPDGKDVSFTVSFIFRDPGKETVRILCDDLKLKKAR